MFAHACTLSLALPFLFGAAGAISVDIGSADSIKSAAKTLAGAIVDSYNDLPKGSPIGMFEDPYFWWESGAMWSGLVEYSHLTGDSQFDAVVAKALWAQTGDGDFLPPNQTKSEGNGDQSVWALAALTAAENGFTKPEAGAWVDLAKNVFEDQALRWDETTCGGGLRWQIFTFNTGYTYKDSISTGNFFLLSARLAQFTGNKTYSEWADKSFKWLQDVKLLTDEYAVFDGTDSTTKCSSVNHIQWTYPFGVLAEGAAVMYNLTNGDDTWKTAVSGFASHVEVFQENNTSVLTEVACEKNNKCDIDQKAFKGLAARSFARAAISAPFVADQFQKILKVSAKAAVEGCSGDAKDVKCGAKWYFESSNEDAISIEDGGLGEVLGALEVVQALLYPQAKAISTGNSTTENTPSPTASGTGAPSGTGSAAQVSGTSAADKMNAAWSSVAFAGLLAILA
ncbi:glycoside hydrolase family 76 protein [Melanomma pulvis-pyrius CBS 109.77]|uniref:Mannan endo-1,6-alpha-mannosidase n=1 Tax=Melanomma pulvis-pyrius CBS 109.77 TaxID=1314802 RepID=A0A6A6XNC6_9PLEO|nr:glycoside hydrolase family 76 protein [Melanomma pulvis-pyrius CBS 109.77]